MTLTVNGKVSAPDGMELEVIETHIGVEQHRFRIGNGADVSLTVYEPKTLILREVHTASAGELEQKPGEQRHGVLDVPDTDKPALEEGDVDSQLEVLDQEEFDTAERVHALLAQFLDTEGQPIQEQLYHELHLAQRAHADARARLVAYQDQAT